MSEYPSDWKLIPIREIITESRINPELDDPSKRISVRLHCEGVEKRSERATDQAGATRYYKRLAGQFIYGKQNLHKGAVGIVPEELDGFCSSQDIPAFDITPTVNPNWFLHLFRQRNFYESLENIATGTGSKRIQPSELGEKEIAVPPLPEQKKIAEILSGIDTTIAAASKEKQHRDRLRRSAIKQLTRGASFTGQRKDSGTEFGMIPAHWECLLVPDCCAIENSKRKPIKKEERSKTRGIYPYHGATRIQDHISEYAYEGDYVLIGEDGDHFSKYDEWEMAQYATGRFNVSNHAHVIKGTHSCSTKWLYYSLLHRDLTYHLTRQGATRFKLSKASLECIPVIFPPPEEQVKMIRVFDSITRSISILADRIIKLQALKTSLSNDLLSGRKRVSV